MSAPPARRRPLATTLLVLLSLASVSVAAELATRLLWKPGAPRALETSPEWEEVPKLRTLFDLVRPNARGVFSGALFENNSAGFRGPERSLEKPPGVFRIVIAGDSVTMGAGVGNEDTYPAVLERALAARHPRRRFQVLNIGMGGLNGRQVIARLEALGLAYQPDLVVYGYTLNDIEGRYYRKTRDPRFVNWRSFDDSPFYLVRLLGPRLLSLREFLSPPRGSYIYELFDNYLNNPSAWGDVTLALDSFAALTRERGLCGVVLLHPEIHYLHAFHPFKRLYAQVGEAADARGLYVVPAFHHFKGRRPADLWVSAVDSHPNPDGHVLLTQALLEGLESLPGACWRRVNPRRNRARAAAR